MNVRWAWSSATSTTTTAALPGQSSAGATERSACPFRLTWWCSVSPDDFELPDPDEPTDKVVRTPTASLTWPFGTLETILLGLLYVAPFAIRWLTHP